MRAGLSKGPDPLPISDSTAGRTGELTHVILAQVHALAPNGQGDIDPVVDEQRHSMLLRDGVQSLCRLYQVSRVARLVPVLHDGDAPADGAVDDVTDVLVAKDRGCGVGHQVEGVVSHGARQGFDAGPIFLNWGW